MDNGATVLGPKPMNQNQWTAIDTYFSDLLLAPDPALAAALATSAEAGLPPINVSATQGALLQLLARTLGAARILEIGTLGGYSTIWLGRGLTADGRLITLESKPRHAEVARQNIARAGLAEQVDIRLGRALDILPRLAKEGAGPFDLVFIDADKASTADYFSWAVELSRPGSLIIVDNVVRGGAVVETESTDPGVVGTRHFLTSGSGRTTRGSNSDTNGGRQRIRRFRHCPGRG